MGLCKRTGFLGVKRRENPVRLPLLPSALPPKGEARCYVANDFLNLIAFPLFDFPAPQAVNGQGIPSRHELIPDAPDGQDVLRMRRIFFHRFTDAIDMDRDRSRIAE